jgi:hypothetical protein
MTAYYKTKHKKDRIITDAVFSVGMAWDFSNSLIEDFRKVWGYCKRWGID